MNEWMKNIEDQELTSSHCGPEIDTFQGENLCMWSVKSQLEPFFFQLDSAIFTAHKCSPCGHLILLKWGLFINPVY